MNPVLIGICFVLYLSCALFCLVGGLMRPLLKGASRFLRSFFCCASGVLGGFFRFVTRVLDVLLGPERAEMKVLPAQRATAVPRQKS